MFFPADLNVSNDELLTVALVVFILCAVLWLIGARPWRG
jgi:hypothetical protein